MGADQKSSSWNNTDSSWNTGESSWNAAESSWSATDAAWQGNTDDTDGNGTASWGGADGGAQPKKLIGAALAALRASKNKGSGKWSAKTATTHKKTLKRA